MSSVMIKLLGDNKDFLKSLDQSEGAVAKFASGATKLITAGAAASAAAFGTGFAGALERQALGSSIAAEMGISPAEAKEMAERAADIYTEAWGESVEQVADVQMQIDMSGLVANQTQLDNLTRTAFGFAEVFDTDVNTAIQRSADLVNSGLAANGIEAMDMLTASMQQVPREMRGEVLDAVGEYSQFFATVSNQGEDFLAGLIASSKDGAFEIDKYGDAIKEFTIRSTDMSQASQDAYSAMGKDAELYAQLMLEGGDAASDAFFGTIRGLQEMEDPIAQANAAIALFGTPLEDMNTKDIPEFLDRMYEAREGIGNFEDAGHSLAETLGDNALTELEAFKRQGLEALTDFATNKFLPAFLEAKDWFLENWPAIREKGEEVVDRLVAGVEWAVDKFNEYWPLIQEKALVALDYITAGVQWVRDKFYEYWPQISAVVGKVVGAITALFREHWPQIKEIAVDALDAIMSGARRFVAIVTGLWERYGEDVVDLAYTAWNTIQSIISGALDIVQGVFRFFAALFKGDWGSLWDAVKQILSGAWEIITGLVKTGLGLVKLAMKAAWDGIKALTSIAWDGIKGALSSAWGKAIDAVEGVLEDIWGAITGAFDDVMGEIGKWGGKLYTAAKKAWDRVKAAVKVVLPETWLAMASWFLEIIGKISGWGSSLYSIAYSAFRNIFSAVTGAVSGVASWLYDNVIGPIISAIEGIMGKIEELKSAAGAVGSVLSGVGNPIAGAVGIVTGGGGGNSDQDLLDAVIAARGGGGGGSAQLIPTTVINNNGNANSVADSVRTSNTLGGIQ